MAPPLCYVPYQNGQMPVVLPQSMVGVVASPLQNSAIPPIANLQEAARYALQHPLSGPPLRELAKGKRRVCIAVTDATRDCPDAVLLPPILDELLAAGVHRDEIVLLVAVGLHRPSRAEEKRDKFGASIATTYRIVDHDPLDPASLCQLPAILDLPIPIQVNRLCTDADLLLSTGIVEPHQYAGYSGGGKTVAIGCAGESFISLTHGPAILDHPGTRLGMLAGNRFQELVIEVAGMAGLRFCINVLPSTKGFCQVAAGPPREVLSHLARLADSQVALPVPGPAYDAVIAGVLAPKDENLYQASRALTYLFARGVVRQGGVLILPAALHEGAGKGTGELRFAERLKQATNPQELVESCRRHGYRPGEQRAYILAQVLAEVQVVVVGASEAGRAAAIASHMQVADTLTEALRLVTSKGGDPRRVLVVPDALHTLPFLMSSGA